MAKVLPDGTVEFSNGKILSKDSALSGGEILELVMLVPKIFPAIGMAGFPARGGGFGGGGVGSRGAQGPQGLQGLQGIQGPQGIPGVDVTLESAKIINTVFPPQSITDTFLTNVDFDSILWDDDGIADLANDGFSIPASWNGKRVLVLLLVRWSDVFPYAGVRFAEIFRGGESLAMINGLPNGFSFYDTIVTWIGTVATGDLIQARAVQTNVGQTINMAGQFTILKLN